MALDFNVRTQDVIDFVVESEEAVPFDVKASGDSYPPYDGPVTVTPGQEEQTLYTNGYSMRSNIVINPIPNNYGLIGWNGSVLTVS